MEIVRKVQQLHHTEWDAFEQLASSIIANQSQPSDPQHSTEYDSSENCPIEIKANSLALQDGKPSQSLCALDVSVRTLRSRARLSTGSKVGVTSLPDVLPHGVKGKEPPSHRLALTDYLIKPIQRICKYPLLLSQLASRKRSSAKDNTNWPVSGRETIHSDVNVIVESALQAMRHVASAVDEARRRQDISIQSSLIVSRISFSSPLSAQYHAPAMQPSPTLTATFLASLGACLLAGSLDVIHHPASSDIVKAKYLGAFLYMGGYFVLVKVRKGKVYEPRHWFSLVDFELVDMEEEEGV